MGTTDGQPLVITQLDGAFAVVTLEDADGSLPEQGVEVGITLREVVSRYPGSATPSTQTMGTEDEPIEFAGQWRDTWGATDGAALARVAAIRAIVRAQSYVEIAWGSAIVRRGYIKSFMPRFLREGIITWKLTFRVSEADEPEVLATAFPPSPTSLSLSTLLDVVFAAAEELVTTATALNNVSRAVLNFEA